MADSGTRLSQVRALKSNVAKSVMGAPCRLCP